MTRAIDCVCREHVHAGVEQRAMGQREQQLLDRPIDAPRAIVGRWAAGLHVDQRSLALEDALSKAELVGAVLIAVGKAEGVDPFDPALQDRRHAVPPQRKLQDHSIGCEQLLLLGDHVGRLMPACVSMARLHDERQPFGVVTHWEVVGVVHCLPLHAVEVRMTTVCPAADNVSAVTSTNCRVSEVGSGCA